MVKILVIDDSLFERKAVLDILQNNGYRDVIEASEGNEGILKCGVENPDIVLLDLRMPGTDGLYVLDRIMEINPETKIIITSIIRDKKTIDDCIKRGACKYISKPISEKKLISAINDLLEGNI
ncbi:MAG: two-component system response regulator [Candidatus Altiarchaeales archaeon ex4484_43]|nr:MAG: two-component system response regulator [Candidatus Altiarchaeales archaeon ex4484_43]